MRKFNCMFMFFAFAVAVNAQDNSFMVYSIKGNVSVVENKTESKAKVGKILNSTAAVKLASGSVLTLICNQAAMFTISKAGNYSLDQFKDSCAVSTSSISANYVKYVWNQMTNHGEGTPGTNRKMFMNTVGAVSRSVNNIWIDPRLDTVNYSFGEFPLSWKSYADADEFEFVLYHNANSTAVEFKTTVKKLKIPISTFLSKLKTGNMYFWTASVKGEQNDELKVFNYVSKENFESLLSTFKNQGPAYESPAEQSYRIAFMLEDAHFLSEAYQYYLKAATADPTNVLFRSTLMSFKKDYEIK